MHLSPAGALNTDEIRVHEVEDVFRHLNPRKSVGPDNTSPKLLRFCAHALAPIYTSIFNKSLSSGMVPSGWKVGEIIPVPKKKTAVDLNDWRPVTLTPVPAKCLESIVKKRIMSEFGPEMDKFQFAYQNKRSTTDAVLALLHASLRHLDSDSQNYVRMLFLDFASAFNTMVPDILVQKMISLNIPAYLCRWTLNFLTKRQQFVRHSQGSSERKSVNIGSPQGCVLSPIFFVIYTNELTSSHDSNMLLKFADDTAIIGRMQGTDDSSYHDDIARTVKWCQENNLYLNDKKTKEVIVDFRKSKNVGQPVNINGTDIERASHYKYLGVIIDNKLSLTQHVEQQKLKMSKRMYCVKRLRRAGVSRHLVTTAYNSFVGSLINYCSHVFFSFISNKDRRIFLYVPREAERMGIANVESVERKIKERAVKLVQDIMNNPGHIFYPDISSCLGSGRTRSSSRMMFCRTERFLRSIIPDTLRILSIRSTTMS